MAELGRADVAIVGGGILGLATAFRLSELAPRRRIAVLEKEPAVARHQSGRNSGVLHAGVYYRPGSLKAENCRAGRAAMVRFCAEHGLPHRTCGKLIVAVGAEEVAALDPLGARAAANGVRVERWGRERIREREPAAAGEAALHVPETGVVDFAAVCRRLAELLEERGHRVVLGAEVLRVATRPGGKALETRAGALEAGLLVNCSGLHGDRVARLDGLRPRARLIPFRGEYVELRPERRGLCRHLVYPVPRPGMPFLGVHFTRLVDGRVECGPNAVLALAREGYRWRDASVRDLAGVLRYPGTWRMAARHWRLELGEVVRSLSRRAFTRALQRLVPELVQGDLVPSRAGVRAQAVLPDGTFVDDFLIEEGERSIHVLNAPSPAATAALVLGERIAGRVVERLAP